MGIQDRKNREKEAFRKLIIATAHDIVGKQGLNGLTMRAIANTIEYSQSKIYEFFKSKDQICEVLFEELCVKLLDIVKSVPKGLKPENYLTQIILKTVEFHTSYPHSDELFTLVCYGPEKFKVPPIYMEMEAFSMEAIRNLKSPYIKTDEEIFIALDTIRCFKIGLLSLMSSGTSLKGSKRASVMAENIIKVLLRGWK